MRRKLIGWALLSLGLAILLSFGAEVGWTSRNAAQPAGADHAKLDGALQELLDRRASGGTAAAQAYGAGQGVEVTSEGRLPVVLEADRRVAPQELQQLRRDLQAQGARFGVRYKTLWEVYDFPLAQATDFARRASVFYMRLPYQATALGSVDGQGTDLTGAAAFHDQGITGEGVKVGVIDFDFQGLQQAMQQGELPEGLATRDWTGQGMEGPSLSKGHGTAVAEIIHEMAPDAELALARISGELAQLGKAMEWMASQDVDVLNTSLGWFNTDFYDCSGVVGDFAGLAHQSEMLWTTAAGNSAQLHYKADYQDQDGNGIHDERPTLEVETSNPAGVGIYLTWNDWGQGTLRDRFSDEDFDLFLLDDAGKQVGASINHQEPSRESGDDSTKGPTEPTEQISARLEPGTYRVQIEWTGTGEAPEDRRLELFVRGSGVTLSPAVTRSSLPEPANCPRSLVVGAVNASMWNQGSPAPYSSRGPTNTGKPKPDLVGPDGVTNWSWQAAWEDHPFKGTSAAAPHAAGAAALLLAESPNLTPQDLVAKLEGRSRVLPEKDENAVGSGALQLTPQAALADLRIADVQVPEAATVGKPITLTAEVANQGGKWAGSFYVTLEEGHGSERTGIPEAEDAFVAGLDSEERQEVSFRFKVPRERYPVTVTADRYAEVDEGDENNNTREVVVEATPPPGELSVRPTELAFRGQAGGQALDPQALTLANAGGRSLDWTAQTEQDWIRLGTTEGTLEPDEEAALEVSVELGNLDSGSHEGRVRVTAPDAANSPVEVPVTLKLAPRLAITSLKFPAEIPSDGSKAFGTIEFADDGDLNEVAFKVAEAVDFDPFSFNPQEASSYNFDPDEHAGSFRFYVTCAIEQEVTLRATLFDQAGNESEPKAFSFECKP